MPGPPCYPAFSYSLEIIYILFHVPGDSFIVLGGGPRWPFLDSLILIYRGTLSYSPAAIAYLASIMIIIVDNYISSGCGQMTRLS
jgi:hypothetical protein